MTPQEAKDYFVMRLKDKYKYAKGHTMQREAFELAEKALEKQIPKKPIKETKETGFKDRFICVSVNCEEVNYRCPVCGEPLGTSYDDDFYNEWLNVCNNCFQRIDWESDNQ